MFVNWLLFEDSLEKPRLTSWLVLSISAGLLAHHGLFIRGEWHLRVPRVVLAHFGLAFALRTYVSDSMTFLTIIVSYVVSLFASIAIYRLVFHRLRHFPGPKLAAVTKLWHIYRARHRTNHLVLQQVHEQYGKVVRTGPNEISIFHPAAIDLLDGPKNTTIKDPWYDVLQPRTSPIFTREEKDHRDRRNTWSQAMSTKALNQYTPRLLALVNKLSQCIDAHDGRPVKVNDVMSWFSFDAMGEFGFGKDFGMMETSTWHPAVARQQRALALLAPLNDSIWLVRLAFAFVPFLGSVKDWMQMVAFSDERMEKRMKESVDKTDAASYFIEEFHQLSDSRSLDSRQALLSGNSLSLIVAGSDTTRATLISLWYFLCKHPRNIDMIMSELKNSNLNDANALAQLPHLNGVINETLRLVPPQLTGGGRITGSEGLWVDDIFIPGGTKVTAPKFVISRLPEAFEQPDEFIPERWYSRPELVRDKRAFGPFTFGNRQCIGKNLALAELRLAAAFLLQRYKVRFAPQYDPELLIRDLKDQVTAQPGECWCIFQPWETCFRKPLKPSLRPP